MAEEARVLQELQSLMRQSPIADWEQELVGRWALGGLPIEPRDGAIGRAQVEIAADLLLAMSVETSSLAVLTRRYASIRFHNPLGQDLAIEIGAAQDDGVVTLNASEQTQAVAWAERLRAAALTLRDFAETDGNAS